MINDNIRKWDGDRGCYIVYAEDYDALAARLAEAELLLRETSASIPGNHTFTLRRISAFLGTVDSAEPRETVKP